MLTVTNLDKGFIIEGSYTEFSARTSAFQLLILSRCITVLGKTFFKQDDNQELFMQSS